MSTGTVLCVRLGRAGVNSRGRSLCRYRYAAPVDVGLRFDTLDLIRGKGCIKSKAPGAGDLIPYGCGAPPTTEKSRQKIRQLK